MLYDIIVIGGGPSGLNCAHKLSQAGLNVLVFDKCSKIGENKICTGIVGIEAFQRFQLSKDSILNEIRNIRIISPYGSLIEYKHPSILAYVVDREKFDAYLAHLALSKGAQMKSKSEVMTIDVSEEQVKVIAREQGVLRVYCAKVAVLATGVNFKFNKMLKLGLPEDFLYGVNAHANIKGIDTTTIHIGNSLAPGAFTWITPIKDGWVRIGLMAKKHPRFYFKKFCEMVSNSNGPLDIASVGYKPIAQGLVSKTCTDRVIAVGETAGQVKTTTGGGIYYGLLCSEIAVQVILKAFKKNSFNASAFSEYEELWKKKIGNEIKTGYYMRKMYSKLTDWQIEQLFHIAKSNGLLSFIEKRMEFDWHRNLLLSLIQTTPIGRFFSKIIQ